MSIRAVDALRTRAEPDDDEPDTVISGWSYYSKDGEPMRTFAPASGFLGGLSWWPEHQREVLKIGIVFPAFELPYGAKGDLACATGGPQPYVLPKAHMIATIAAVCKSAPLSWSSEQLSALNLTCHSHHGSPSDMAQFINAAGKGFGIFSRDDVRELGHWLRLGGQEALAEGGPDAPVRHRGAPRDQHAPNTFDNSSGECAARYVEGSGRRGRRAAQLDVRQRWVRAVRAALAQSGKAWFDLPHGRGDWEIFRARPSPVRSNVVLATAVASAPPPPMAAS